MSKYASLVWVISAAVVHGQPLEGGQLVDTGLAVQSSYPRLLLAAVWHDRLIAMGGVVDVDHAGVNASGNPYTAGDVAGDTG